MNSEDKLVVYDEDFAAIQQSLRKSASKRRKTTTSPGIKKQRKIGKDRETGEILYADTVERENYQVWLDENFPGWSFSEHPQFTVDYVTDEQGRQYPVMVNCDVLLRIVDNKIIRLMSGTGTCQIFKSEIVSDKDAVLKFKRTIAKTNAIKDACNWLYAFWDTRTNEDERDQLAQLPDEEDKAEFEELCRELTEEGEKVARKKFATHSKKTVREFLDKLRLRIEEHKQSQGESNNDNR